MKERALLLFILFLCLGCRNMHSQALPSAEILTGDAAWCDLGNNLRVAEILISGEIDTSRFDLVVSLRGDMDTLVNLPSGVFPLYLNNQPGRNEYIVFKVIEYQEYTTLENDVNDTLIMEVHPWPDMTFTADYESLCSPVDVIFRAKEGYPSYSWDFGDGTGAITSTNWASHSYASQEDVDEIRYTTGLSIYTAFGCEDSVTDTISIYPTPLADFQVHPELLYYPNRTVYLDNSTTPGSWEFRWDFGDGSGAVSRDPGEHIYSGWGIFNIEMLWFTPYCSDSISKQIEILPPAPLAAFSPDTSACPPLQISFRNQTLYAESYSWDFDDGTFSTGENPSHTFHESGTYHVKLIATGASGKDSTEQLVTVFNQPVAMFETDITETNMLAQEFSFNNNSIDGIRFLWDFGDGNFSEEENPKHVFGQTGSYTITLYTWNSEECPDTLVMENMINIQGGEGSTGFPNVFKWNGTGPTGGYWSPRSEDNTVFHPEFENAVGLEMQILTRFGHKVFETNELYVGWDGYINATHLAEQGVYIYRATITYSDGSQELVSGDLTFLH